MVDPDLEPYEAELERMRQEYQAEDKKESLRRDEEYRSLLEQLNNCLGIQLASFDDFNTVPPDIFESKVAQLGDIIVSEDRQPARLYAVLSLMEIPDIHFDALVAFYEQLRKIKDEEYSRERESVAQELVLKANDDHAEKLLNLVRSIPKQDEKFVLLYGFNKVKDARYNTEIQNILREALKYPETIWPAAEVTRKKKYRALLPDLQKALELTEDNEVRRVVQKAIDSLQ
jgi:hypothetical protein